MSRNATFKIAMLTAILQLCFPIVFETKQCFSQATQQRNKIVDRQTVRTELGEVTTGRFRVFEDRRSKMGRQIHLNFVVLHATGKTAKPDPFFFIVGGPGQAATTMRERLETYWVRQERDIVLLDQRGTGGDNRLQFQFAAGEESLQSYLESMWTKSFVELNRDRLSKKHNLKMYSTQFAADDLNDFRSAIGYEKINIAGGSYGTRASLVYIRRHGATVRTATLSGCAPIEFRNPLYHAEGAQRCLDLIFNEVESNPKYVAAFGDLRRKFDEIATKLDSKPITVNITNRSSGREEPVTLTKQQFMSSVRFQTYYIQNSRRLPLLLSQAHTGNYRPFVLSALRQNIALRQSIAQGMLLSVTTAEDLSRIREDEIEMLTRDTYLGDARVKEQLAAGVLWPKSELDPGYGEPVKSAVQTLIFSGTLDPVTPPKWGELVHENFTNSVHVVVPAAHDIGGACVEEIKKRFLTSGTVEELDIRCSKELRLPDLVLEQ